MSKRKFVIATDSRVRQGEVLFLVDRHRKRDAWWSNELKDALLLTHGEAGQRLATIRLNNPRILTEDEAKLLARTPPEC